MLWALMVTSAQCPTNLDELGRVQENHVESDHRLQRKELEIKKQCQEIRRFILCNEKISNEQSPT